MSDKNRGWTKGPDSHELYVTAMEEKAASELAAQTGSPAPSWDDFARRVKKEWPQMEPLIRGQEWMNLYAVFKMGYGAALEDVAKLLAQENNESSNPAPTI